MADLHGPRRRRAAALAAAWPVAYPGSSSGLRAAFDDALTALVAALASERERRTPFLWLPVAFGFGICLYFVADSEPGAIYPAAVGVFFLAGAWAAYTRPVLRGVCLCLAMVLLGFTAGVMRTAGVAAPRLERTVIGPLTGFVESIERREGGDRLVILVESLASLKQDERPTRVRATLRGASPVAPGAFIQATARLLPPPEPARPGGYDFGRDAFFKGIGGVGSLLGKVREASPPHPPGTALRVAAAVDWARNVLTERIARGFGGQGGAVAAALVTGKRGLIDEKSNDALRAAGIYHIVSISGLHMVLAAGAVFGGIRGLLAAFAPIALNWPIKKIAAVGAMIGASAYCIFSGSDVATERSLIMTLVMLGAILVNRPALSLRNLALSALIVLAREPETLLGPSFQMSFGAVAALIAFGNAVNPLRKQGLPGGVMVSALRGGVQAFLALLGTTLIATLATAPFGLFHFQALNPYGLLGNAMALPFVSLVVMPCAVIGTLLYPLGLDGPVWWAMGAAVQAVLWISAAIQELAGARSLVPAFGSAALAGLATALLLLTLLTTRLRWLAVVPLAVGLLMAASPRRPLVLIDREASGIAVRGQQGRLVMLGRPSAFVQAQWLTADGDARMPGDVTLAEGRRCDAKGCVARLPDGRAVSFLVDRSAFAEDCRLADIIILKERAGASCPGKLVIDRLALQEGGAMAIFESGPGPSPGLAADPTASPVRPAVPAFSVERARASSADRPWGRPSPKPRRQPASNTTPGDAGPSPLTEPPIPELEDPE